jgi:hypothetical protein
VEVVVAYYSVVAVDIDIAVVSAVVDIAVAAAAARIPLHRD